VTAPRTEDLAARLAELAAALSRGDPDRPPAEVVLRTLLRYVRTHGSTCAAAKAIAESFDRLLEAGAVVLSPPRRGCFGPTIPDPGSGRSRP